MDWLCEPKQVSLSRGGDRCDGDETRGQAQSQSVPASLRLLFLQPQAENAGAQEIARLLVRGLAERGHVTKQVFYFRRTATFEAEGETAYCAQARPASLPRLLTLLYRLHQEIRAFQPDVVLCFQHYGNVIGAPIARLAGAPFVLANQNSGASSMAPGVRYADRWLGRLGVYDHIIGVSHSATTAYESYPETYRKKIVRIDHGVATKRSALSRSAARAKLGLPLEKVLLGCAARLHPAKYLEAAIGLLPSEPTWRLALAGQGPDHERLKQVARDLGCEGRIHWLGELDPPGIGDFLAALDVFVFPSLTETFGLAAVEAAQAGVPVVANDLPVLR